MTQKLKDKIRSLRLSGVGYGSIAKQLNIPEDTVKTHCRRNGLTGQITLSKEGPTTLTTTYAPAPPPKNKRASYKHTACTVICTFSDTPDETAIEDIKRLLLNSISCKSSLSNSLDEHLFRMNTREHLMNTQ